MFDYKHYVPILKAKGGEFWALANLKPATKSVITPVIELVPPDKKNTFEGQLEKKLIGLKQCWPESPFFFDVRYATSKSELPSAATLNTAFKRSRVHEINAIPVTRLGYSQKFQEALKGVIETDGNGVMIRLGGADLGIKDKLHTALSNLCKFLGISEKDAHLLIDYGFRHPDEYEDLIHLQELHLGKVPTPNKWRTLTVASASFPESIKDLPTGKWEPLDRTEWRSWECLTLDNAPRRPAYGDYGVRHPSLPGFGTPKPNLRYTLENQYLCRRDNAKHVAMKAICKSLIALPEYMGPKFSNGDLAISKTAANQSSGGTGGGKEWTQWCSNHHFEFVATQIQSLPAA